MCARGTAARRDLLYTAALQERVMNPAVMCSLLLTTMAGAQDAGPTFAGRVLDENGAPLANVAVALVRDASTYVTNELAPQPAATTGADGGYVVALPVSGRERGNALLFVAKGRVHVLAPLPLAPGWPIVLPKGVALVGRVVDADRKPVEGVRVEAREWLRQARYRGKTPDWLPEARTAVRTDHAGMFVLDGAMPAGVNLVAGEGRDQSGSMPVALGDPIELVYELAAATPARPAVVVAGRPARTIAVTALGPDGQPMRAFRCAAVRTDDAWLSPRVRQTFEAAATAAVDGEVRAAVAGQRDGKVCVVATADGMAMTCVPLDDGVDEVALQFAPEATLAGTVVDADGKPVAGAKLWVFHGADALGFEVAWAYGQSADRFDARGGYAITDANGAFVVHHVRGGEQRLACLAGNCSKPLPLAVSPQRGEAVRGLKIEVVRYPAIAGTTQLARPPLHGAFVRCIDEGEVLSAGLSMFGLDSSPAPPTLPDAVPVAADGTFRLPSIAPGRYAAQLVVPRALGQGEPDVLAIKNVDIDAKTNSLAFDLRDLRPARVHGTVRGPVPSGRLLVGVSGGGDVAQGVYLFAQYDCPLAVVAPGGAFRLSTRPGPATLFVIDAWTGMLLHREERREFAPDADLTVDLSVAAVPLDVRFEGQRADAAWLELRMPEAALPNGIDRMLHMGQTPGPYGMNLGCIVTPATGSLQLWWPAVAGELWLVAGDGNDVKTVHDKASFDLADGAVRAVTLKFPR